MGILLDMGVYPFLLYKVTLFIYAYQLRLRWEHRPTYLARQLKTSPLSQRP